MYDLDSRPGRIRASVAGPLGAVLMPLFACNTAIAQEEPPPRPEVQLLEEVIVTGTRIRQTGDYASPTPLVTLDADHLENLGIVNVADAITQIPLNVSQIQPANVGGTAFFVGSTLANIRGLNPFFGTRTLTLVDSRRHVPTTQGGSVDLNFIPQILISRMEIVSGGGSASYGSEAISGVVNILLDKKLQGLKFESDFGTTRHGDGDNWHAAFAGGTELFDGRAHLVVGAEYQDQDVIQSCADARKWCRDSVGFLANGGGFVVGTPYTNPKVPGQPHNVIVSGLRRNQESTSGVIFNNAPDGTVARQFTADGTGLADFNIGELGTRSVFGDVVGGDGLPIYTNLTLYPEQQRLATFAHLSFEFTDRLSGFFETSFGEVEAVNRQDSPFNNTQYLCLRPDNAYLNPAQQAAVIAGIGNGAASFFCAPFGQPPQTLLIKNFVDDIDQKVTTDTRSWRAVTGLQGRIGERWYWDTYYQFGKTERDQIGRDYFTNFRMDMALDSVIDNRPGSPTFGQPVCRVTRDGANFFTLPTGADPVLAQGCQPINVFGVGNMSPEGRAYAIGDLTESNEIEQQVVAINFDGELWDGWGAGPLKAATGAEYRREKMDNLAGDLPFAQRTDFALQYGDPFGGKTTVTEAYVELEMPLLKDKPGAKQAYINGAIREARYENQGGIGTDGTTGEHDIVSWKLAGVWDPVGWMRVRGSRSHDVRAGGFRELYYSQSSPPGAFFCGVTNPWLPDLGPFTQCANGASTILSGNPSLEPEEADTWTAGLVFLPGGFLQGANFSVDYYDIELRNGISLGSAQETIRLCFEENNQAECDRITFGPPTDPLNPRSNLTSVRSPYRNLLPYSAKGLDFSASYYMPLNKWFSESKGALSFWLNATRAIETRVQSGETIRDIAGQTGGDSGFGGFSDFAASPDWAGNLAVTYIGGPLRVTTQFRYTSKGKLDKQMPKTAPGEEGFDPTLVGSVSDNTVPSSLLVNLNASYDFKWFDTEQFQLYLSVDNLLDKDPPFAQGFVGGTNPIYFDALGRSYRVGMRAKF